MANEKENLQTEEEVETAQTEAADETAETQAGTEESALQAQYDELNDRYLRMAAEYDNFRKRSRAERDSVHAEAVAYAVKALLATVDNLSRALAQPTEDAAYKQGIEMTYNQMMESFQSLGVTEIVACVEPGTPIEEALARAEENYRRAAARVFAELAAAEGESSR